MYRYKKENQLVTSAIPLQGLTLVILSDEDAKYFVGSKQQRARHRCGSRLDPFGVSQDQRRLRYVSGSADADFSAAEGRARSRADQSI